MIQKFTLFLFVFAALAGTSGVMAQKFANPNQSTTETAVKTADRKQKPEKPSAAQKQVDVMGSVDNGYVPGTTHNLYFTFEIANTDFEYVDSVSMTFPDGMTLNSVSNNVVFGPSYDAGGEPEAFNGIDGQQVSWGDNDNDFGGITSQGSVYYFSANVTNDVGLTGDQTIEVHASGDGFGDTPGDQDFTITVSETESLPARVQVIHNSGDEAAAVVDIRINGELPAALDDVEYRTASPFLTVPSETPLIITINPADSEDDTTPIHTLPLNDGLDSEGTYIIIAEGIVSDMGYDPDNLEVPFNLNVFAGARETAATDGNVDILVSHGATDAPVVDINEISELSTLLFGSLAYGDIQGYEEVPVGDYALQVADVAVGTEIAAYSAPLQTLGLENLAVTVLASGFVFTENNSDGPEFGLWAALPFGGPLVELPEFTATDEPCNALLVNTTGESVTINNSGATAADGEVAPPNGGCSTFSSWCDGAEGAETAEVTNSIWFSFVAPASGAVEVSTCNPGTNFDTQVAVWQAGDCADFETYTFIGANDDYDVDGPECSAESDFASRLTACGLIEGEEYLIQVDGYAGETGDIELAVNELDASVCTARLQVVHNSADDAATIVDVRLNGDFPTEDFDDLEFRTATPTIDAPAGVPLDITINASTSVDDSDPILLLEDVTLEPGGTYQVIAQGIVSELGYDPGPGTAPLELAVINGYLEANPDENNTFVAVVHGATDAPAVDIDELFVLNDELFGNLAYGDVQGYANIPTDNYTLGLTVAGETDIVAAFSANLAELNLGGFAISVFASGFLDPSANSDGPDFGLWASIPEGGPLIPLQNVTSVDEIESLSALNVYPNPALDEVFVELDLVSGSDVSYFLYDNTGRMVKSKGFGSTPAGFTRNQFNVSNLANGLYILNIQIGDETVARKLQINR